MMEDQLNKYVKLLKRENYRVELENEKIKLCVDIEGKEIILYCVLGEFFPYEIPQIFIEAESKKKIPNIPHLYTDNSICIFDKSKVIPNFNEPYQLVLDTINEAITVIKKGITGGNCKDFIDEFLEYWSVKKILKAQMFIENLIEGKQIYYCFMKKELLISDSIQRLKEIYHAITGESLKEKGIFNGVFIPLNGEKVENIPKNDIHIVQMIEKYSQYNKFYNSFMQKHIKDITLIVFNQLVEGKNMVAGWLHDGPGIPNGFRKGHVNLKAAFKISSKKGFAIAIENCHQNRLFTRGGDGSMSPWRKVGIIGCGSIGGFLADALKLSGVEKFALVDNEDLEYENVARHPCGYHWVHYPKTIDLGISLQNWNPNIVYESYVENAHSFVENRTEIINDCDVLFVAVACATVEHHVNKLILENRIKIPVVFLWGEPYLLGGHAILVKKPQDLYKEIFDAVTLEYKYRIVEDGTKYLKREAGCQSTYMPYSGFQLQQFIYRVIECLESECWEKKGNYRITWCGKLSNAKNLKVQICNEYSEIKDYSLIKKRID